MDKKYYQDKRYAWVSIFVLSVITILTTGLWVIFLIWYLLYYFRSYVEITDKGIKIIKWAVVMSEQYLLYNKINNVELQRSVISFGSINFFVGKDKPITFKNISHGKEIRDIVMDKMDK